MNYHIELEVSRKNLSHLTGFIYFQRLLNSLNLESELGRGQLAKYGPLCRMLFGEKRDWRLVCEKTGRKNARTWRYCDGRRV